MPIATAVLGFVVMFFFGSATGHIATVPTQIGKTIEFPKENVRFYDITERHLTGVTYDLVEIKNECVCREKKNEGGNRENANSIAHSTALEN